MWVYRPDHKYSETKKGWLFEHKEVMENFLKRKLKPSEVIHHLNSNREDNRISNLMLFKSNAEHQKFHTKIRQFGMTTPIIKQIEERWKIQEKKCQVKNIYNKRLGI